MIGWVILLFLLLLLLLPIRARFRFNGEGRLVVRYGGIPVFRVSSAEKKEDAKKKNTSSSPRKAAKTKSKKSPVKAVFAQLKEEGVEAVAEYLSALVQWVNKTVRRVLRILWFGRCDVHIVVATPESSETALRYGKACAVICPAAEVLRQNLHIRRLTLRLEPDFLREKDEVHADIRLCVLPIMVLWAAIVTLFAYVGVLIKQGNTNQRKDVEHG